MNACMRGFLSVAAVLALTVLCSAADPAAPDSKATPASPIYLVANEDLAFPFQNEISFYLAGGTQLTLQNNVLAGGFGIQGGFFGTSRVASIPSLSAPCLYVSNAASNDLASISLQGQQLVGNFSGSQTDDGSKNGIGVSVNTNYLYASFTSSNTIGTFALQTGCGLTFLGDVSATGLQGGSVSGMAVNGKILVVAYGDGSIQSFNVDGGMPVSNNDLQNSTGYGGQINFWKGPRGNMPSGVDITQDGRFAIFGDISAAATVEVSSLTAGKLAKTVPYTVGTGVDAGAIRLSPDQSLLYMANSESGTVTAAFFNPRTGKVTKGCASPTLQGFNGRPWLGSVVARDTSGTGNVLYVGEFGRDHFEPNHGPSSAIGVLTVTSNGVSCRLTEASGSPLLSSYPGMLSVGVYPPRPF
jgi:6-phosphogluconolactonase (cycloisomerase 2 family)